MKIGIISDTHDDLRALTAALQVLREEAVTMLLHCGDLSGPAVVEALSEFDTWISRGNVDRHPELERTVVESQGRGRLAERHTFTLNGRTAVMVHGHREGELRSLIHAEKYRYLFHGHTHRRRNEWIGQTQVINPGALGGMRWQQRSFCVLNPQEDQLRFIEV